MVEGGGHTQSRLLQQPHHQLEGEGREGRRAAHHNVLSPPGAPWQLLALQTSSQASDSWGGGELS